MDYFIVEHHALLKVKRDKRVMAIRLRTVEDLAREMGSKADAKMLLAETGVRVVNNTFDQNRLEAAVKEPKWLRNRRNEWSLSHHTGLGAVKFLLDPLKISIVQHECKGAQWLMLESLTRKRQYVKMYYKGTLQGMHQRGANFQIRNFLREDAPDYYLLVAFEGPHMWAVPRRHLITMWRKLLRGNHVSVGLEGFSVPDTLQYHEFGALNAYMLVGDPIWNLDDIGKLGLA